VKIVISVFLVFFILVSLSEFIQVYFISDEGYPFGSDFFGTYSTYKSKVRYLIFNSLVVIFGLLAFKNYKKRLFYLFAFALFLLETYNLIT
jgi:hypothetical protein